MNLDPKLWKNLPYDLVRYIIGMSDPSIDTRLSFGIPPKRLAEAKCWKLWYLLKSHDGIIYNLESKSLHIFRVHGHHIIRRPIELNYHTAGILVFNDTGDEHMVEDTGPCGSFSSRVSRAAWLTELRMLFKGATPSRKLSIEDSMLVSAG
jgi:hypothetical protein